MNFTRDMNDGRTVFVFGSNESGIHGAGAALEARRFWGAIPGVGFGLMGHCFAIPTKDWQINTLPLEIIAFYVGRFIVYTHVHPHKSFLVTPIGTGLAGYRHNQIAPMFKGASANCTLPPEWREYHEKAAPR
jgi:hypothetical protein